MADQSGIQRRSPITTITPLMPARTIETAAAQLRQVHEDMVALQRSLDVAYDTITRRSNEMLMSGTLAQRPPSGVRDRFYYATDTGQLFYDDGT